MFKLTAIQGAVLISLLALSVSGLNFYFSFLRKGKPRFICSSFTALGMEYKKDGISTPRAAFAIKIRVINNGKHPLILKDIILVARHKSEKEVIKYEPIMLFDFQKYIEHQGKADRIGRAQAGQVSLPMAIPAEESHDFVEHVLFLPLDKKTMIQPLKAQPARIKLYALTNRSIKYKLIGEQVFPAEDIKGIKMGDFSSVISDESTEERETFFNEFKWEKTPISLKYYITQALYMVHKSLKKWRMFK